MPVQQQRARDFDITKIAAAAFCFFTIAVFYPGVMSPDSMDMLTQAETGTFVETSAPIMSLLWRALHFFIWGPAPMLVFQVVAWWAGLWLIFAKLVPDCRSARGRWIRIAGMAIVGFWPPVFAMIGTIWNTVHMCIAYTIASGFLIRNREHPKRSELYIAAICVAYGTGVRPNALFSAIPLAACIGVLFWKTCKEEAHRKLKIRGMRLAMSSALTIAAIFGGMAANKMIGARPFTPLQNLLAFDLAGISARTGRDLIPASVRTEYDNSPARLAALYTAFTCVPLYLGTGQIGARVMMTDSPAARDPEGMVADLKRSWLDAVKQAPKAYLAHRTAVFFANMGWNDLPPHYPFERGIIANRFNLKPTPSKFSNGVYSVLDALLVHARWLFRPWIYLLITLSVMTACCAVRFVTATGGRHMLTPVLLGSSLFYTLPYLFVAPAADLRYHLWPMVTALLSLPLFRHELRHQLAGETRDMNPITVLGGALALYSVIAVGLSFAIKPHTIYYGPAARKSPAAIEAYNSGLEHLNKNDYTGARELFLKASKAAPHWHIPYLNLAIIGKVQGADEQAAAYYDRAVELDIGNEKALSRRAGYRLEKKEYQAAVSDVERSIRMGGTDFTDCLTGAKASAFLGNAQASAMYSYICHKSDPKRFARDIVEVVNPYFQDPALLEAGIEYFEILKGRIPDTWWVYHNLGSLLSRKGDKPGAEAAFNRAKELKQ